MVARDQVAHPFIEPHQPHVHRLVIGRAQHAVRDNARRVVPLHDAVTENRRAGIDAERNHREVGSTNLEVRSTNKSCPWYTPSSYFVVRTSYFITPAP